MLFLQKYIVKHLGLALIATSPMLFENHLQAATLDEVIRPALAERLTSRDANSLLKETPISSANVQVVMRDNLNPGLMTGVVKTRGTDFRMTQFGQQTQFAILIFTYHNEETALRMSSKLSKLGGYFKHTKILTRFSCIVVGNELAVAFTENAGSEDVVKFIEEFPLILRKIIG